MPVAVTAHRSGRGTAGAGAPPVVTLTVPASPLAGSVALSAAVTDTIAIAKVEFWVDTTLVGTVTTAPYTVMWDTTAGPNGPVTIEAKAWDMNGNGGSSAASAATITN
jgi:large repetitive protein